VSQVVGVVDPPPPQDVNTAVKMLSATNVTFFILFVFVLRINLPLISMLFYRLYYNIRIIFHFAKSILSLALASFISALYADQALI
jgi:hypothetical protein